MMFENRKKLTGLTVLLSLMLFICMLSVTQAQIKSPAAPPVQDVTAYAKIRNLPAILDNVDSWVSRVQPGMPPGMVKMMMGQYLGDPTLAGIDTSLPILIITLDPKKYTNPLVMYLPAKTPGPIQEGIKAKGSFTVLKGNTIIVGDDQPAVMRGVEIFAQLKSLISSPASSDIEVYYDVEKFMAIFGVELKQKIKDFQTQIKMMQGMGSAPGSSPEQNKQTEAQITMLFDTVEQIKSVVMKIDTKKEDLTLAFVAEAKPGTELAGMLKNAGAVNPSIYKMLPDGAVKMVAAISPEAKADLGDKFINGFVKNSGTFSPEQLKAMKGYSKLQKEILGGETAVSFFLPGGMGINGVTLWKLKNPKRAIEFIRASKEQATMGSNPAQGLTITADYKENFRKVGDVAVHKISIKMNMTDPMAAQQMKMFFPTGGMDIEMAVVKDILIAANGTPIDDAITRVKKGTGNTTLVSMSQFPPGGQIYGDVSLQGVVKTLLAPMFAMMAMGGGQNPLAALDKINAPPITINASIGGGKASGKLNLKLDTIVKFKEAFSSMGMGGAPGAPSGM
jgi:uncharacterized protein (DUF952 family)